MKKLLLVSLLFVTGVAVHAQGTFTFANNSATRVTNGVGTTAPNTGAAGATVAVYFSSNTNLVTAQDRSGLQINLGAVTNTLSAAAAGLFIGGTRTIPGVPEQGNVAMQIRAWTGAFADYEAAFAAAQGGDGSIYLGESRVFLVTALGGPGGTPTPGIFSAGRLNAFTVQPLIPEPSSIALGLLGLGAIALFRRRK
jgi:hypothetical protein